jgi:hypothetical protein
VNHASERRAGIALEAREAMESIASPPAEASAIVTRIGSTARMGDENL